MENEMDKHIEGYAEYLVKTYSPATAARYQRAVVAFIAAKASLSHGGITKYLGGLRATGKDPRVCLYAIKTYCSYLLRGGMLKADPSVAVKLMDKGARDIQLQDLFSNEELAALLEKPGRYAKLQLRNRCMLGLLIYQALTLGELIRLRVTDIDLVKGLVSIRGTSTRVLQLQPPQIHALMLYIYEQRKALQQSPTDALLLTMQGKAEKGEGIRRLLQRLNRFYPNRTLNATTIRQSVIANLLKHGADLRYVQTFAGHKWPSSTERYRRRGLEELKAAVALYHPLDEAVDNT